MSSRILLILLAMAAIAIAVDYSAGEVTFTQGDNMKTVQIAKINDPQTILSLNDVNYGAPFSLAMNSRILSQGRRDLLQIAIFVNNATIYLAQVQISVRYLVIPKLSGFEIFTFNLSAVNNRRTILPQAASSNLIKRGYFITGFSSIAILDFITVQDAPGNFFYMVLNYNSPLDWVQINFVVVDISTSSGCPTHNLYNGTVNSAAGQMAKARFSLAMQQNTEVMVGLANLKSFNGTFQWVDISQGEAFAYGSGVFSFVILQLDIDCALTAPIVVLPSGTSTPGIQIPDRDGNLIPIPIVLPINNNRVNYWNLPNSETSSFPLAPNSLQPNQNVLPVSTPTVMPFSTFQVSNSQSNQVIKQTAASPTISYPIQTSSTTTTIIQPSQPTTTYITPTEPQSPQSYQSSQNSLFQPLPSYISAWKILGFVILSWIVISVLAIPLLCCLLWRSRKRQHEEDQIIKRYVSDEKISEPAEDFMERGTDVRLRNNLAAMPLEMKEIPSQLRYVEKIQYHEKMPSVLERVTEISDGKVSSPILFKEPLIDQRFKQPSSIKVTDSQLKYSSSGSQFKSFQPQPSEIGNDPSQIRYSKPSGIKPTSSQIKYNENEKKDSEDELKYQQAQQSEEPEIRLLTNQKEIIPSIIQKKKESEIQEPAEKINSQNGSQESQQAEMVIKQSPSPVPSEINRKESQDGVNQETQKEEPTFQRQMAKSSSNYKQDEQEQKQT